MKNNLFDLFLAQEEENVGFAFIKSRLLAGIIPGEFLSEFLRVFFALALLLQALFQFAGDTHSTLADRDPGRMRKRIIPADGTLEALGRNPRPTNTAEFAIFGIVGIIAVQIGWSKVLDQMNFDEHVISPHIINWKLDWCRRQRVFGTPRIHWPNASGWADRVNPSDSGHRKDFAS